MNYDQEQLFKMQQVYGRDHLPFYMTYPMQNAYMTEIEYERDMERMKELYPAEAKKIQRLVEETCNRLEYEGSMLYDESPDRLMLRQLSFEIYQKAKNVLESGKDMPAEEYPAAEYLTAEYPAAEYAEETDSEAEAQKSTQVSAASMPGRPGKCGPGRPCRPLPPPRNDGLMDLIEVLLYNEMFKRRCRNRRCRRWW